MYYEGKFVEKDINKALEYYEKSELQGNSEAIYRIGILHEKELIP